MLHISALGADAHAPSEYLRSKAIGEQAVLAADDLDVTVFRPSVVFGPEDRFLNQFAMLARFLPVLALPMPHAKFKPVYVGDVASAMLSSVKDPDTWGKAYELCGPRVYELQELVKYVCAVTGRRRVIIGLPGALARLPESVEPESVPVDTIPLPVGEWEEAPPSEQVPDAAQETASGEPDDLGLPVERPGGVAERTEPRTEDPRDHPDGRRLPRPVRAQEPEQLPRPDLQVQRVDRREVAVPLRQPFESNHSAVPMMSSSSRPISRISSTCRASPPVRKRRCDASAGYWSSVGSTATHAAPSHTSGQAW